MCSQRCVALEKVLKAWPSACSAAHEVVAPFAARPMGVLAPVRSGSPLDGHKHMQTGLQTCRKNDARFAGCVPLGRLVNGGRHGVTTSLRSRAASSLCGVVSVLVALGIVCGCEVAEKSHWRTEPCRLGSGRAVVGLDLVGLGIRCMIGWQPWLRSARRA